MNREEEHKEQPEPAVEETAETTEASSANDVEARLSEAEREKEQFKKLAQRAQADLVNFRNRMRADQDALLARTAERVAGRFIEIADQLEKALAAEATAGVEEQWVSGVEGIYQNLLNVLKAEGFERFDADGDEFDPRRHDALLATPTAEYPPNHVIRQIAAGYTRNGEVVRPAQVEIASATETGGEPDGATES